MKFHSHAAHVNKSLEENKSQSATAAPPSQQLHAESEHVRHLLEHLDDVIFQALRGDASSLALAHELWPQVLREIGWELVEESREQYLRYAVDLTRQYEEDRLRNPENAISAVEVIELLSR